MPKTYTIGPLHELLKTKLSNINTQESYQSSNSLWEVDRSCITWLDTQPPQSVIYISFGSVTELKEGPKQRGYIVKWAPQEEVLAHKAVDQQVNSRFVREAWKLGLDMKDVCDRGVVENMVNDLMEDRRDEFVRSTARMAELARKSVSEGGSSSCNLDRLIEDIRKMSVQANDNGQGSFLQEIGTAVTRS
ncbi:hypothetical protein GH714_025795 [Hevea brasiliensis]|uniref:Uncharacterized protein n=1 Tax=Hevea brasiliensis TaxID=3981 RepID=A0A6A6L0N5_HEVBR|nr:hypothetical protein GH714_025795 [Hevea brasiliensis]